MFTYHRHVASLLRLWTTLQRYGSKPQNQSQVYGLVLVNSFFSSYKLTRTHTQLAWLHGGAMPKMCSTSASVMSSKRGPTFASLVLRMQKQNTCFSPIRSVEKAVEGSHQFMVGGVDLPKTTRKRA